MEHAVSARRLRKSMLGAQYSSAGSIDIDNLILKDTTYRKRVAPSNVDNGKIGKTFFRNRLNKIKTRFIVKIFISSLILFAIVTTKLAFYDRASNNKLIRLVATTYTTNYGRVEILEKSEEIMKNLYNKINYAVPKKVVSVVTYQYINNIKPRIIFIQPADLVKKMIIGNSNKDGADTKTLVETNATIEKVVEASVNLDKTKELVGIGGGNPINESADDIKEAKLSESISAISSTDIYISQILSKANSIIKPVVGRLSSSYGAREVVFSGVDPYHTGIDIANSSGTKIVSATNGKVVNIETNNKYYGKMIEIETNGVIFKYGHLSNIIVKVGNVVKQGQQIGAMGNTGLSTGTHLHFEIRINGVSVDPMEFVKY